MAKITIAGDAVVITSTKKLEDIKTLSRFRPKALQLLNEDKKIEFAVGITSLGGNIGKCGVSFPDTTRDPNGLASVTLLLGEGVVDAKKYIAEEFGASLASLKKVEAQIDAAIAEVNAEREAIEADITVAG